MAEAKSCSAAETACAAVLLPPPSSTVSGGVYAIRWTLRPDHAWIVRKWLSLDLQSFTCRRSSTETRRCSVQVSSTLSRTPAISTFMGGKRSRRVKARHAGSTYPGLRFAFVSGQYVAWGPLRGRRALPGVSPTNPVSSFFYLLTAAHVLQCVLGSAGRTASM